MCDSGIDDFPCADNETLCAGMESAAKLGLPVAVHAEDPVALAQAAATVRGDAWQDYLASRPAACECAASRVAIECARATGCALHIVHVSCPSVLDVIRFERERGGIDVTCETCPHYFMLSEDDVQALGARGKCAPPLRTKVDAELLVAALHAGDIDFVASDHSPAPPSMKDGLGAFKAWGGIAGVQSTLSALLTQWMNASYPFRQIGPLIAANAAERFRIPDRGRVDVARHADFVLVDTGDRFVLTHEMLLDRHKLSPYIGRTFRGRVRRTILRGRTIFLDGKTVGPPSGKFIRPAR
jgi:allantoinase